MNCAVDIVFGLRLGGLVELTVRQVVLSAMEERKGTVFCFAMSVYGGLS